MKKNNIIYWGTTGLIGAVMLFSAYSYFTNAEMKAEFTHLGFPDYFRVELGVAKILGALALLIPAVPSGLKQLAYAGFALVFISASIAHFSNGDPMPEPIMPLIFMGILAISYVYAQKMSEKTA